MVSLEGRRVRHHTGLYAIDLCTMRQSVPPTLPPPPPKTRFSIFRPTHPAIVFRWNLAPIYTFLTVHHLGPALSLDTRLRRRRPDPPEKHRRRAVKPQAPTRPPG